LDLQNWLDHPGVNNNLSEVREFVRPKINDVVCLLDDIPGEGLFRGTLGTIVAAFSEPQEAYEVEFCTESGRTLAQLALDPTQFFVVQGPAATK
jgi:hypothetical protein